MSWTRESKNTWRVMPGGGGRGRGRKLEGGGGEWVDINAPHTTVERFPPLFATKIKNLGKRFGTSNVYPRGWFSLFSRGYKQHSVLCCGFYLKLMVCVGC